MDRTRSRRPMLARATHRKRRTEAKATRPRARARADRAHCAGPRSIAEANEQRRTVHERGTEVEVKVELRVERERVIVPRPERIEVDPRMNGSRDPERPHPRVDRRATHDEVSGVD